jgi:hypothetical protein
MVITSGTGREHHHCIGWELPEREKKNYTANYVLIDVCFEGLRYVPRKEKNTSSTRDSYCVFGGEFYCQKIIDLLNAICLGF